MKKEVLVFLAENYADWEGAYICPVLNKPETEFIVKTLSASKDPVISMGGFAVSADYQVDAFPEQFEMLILIGGTSWSTGKNTYILPVIEHCIQRNIPIAAICDAGTFLADHGYLDHITHTGNSCDYLKKFAPNYKGEAYFVEKQAVSANGWITANGTAAVEFAREILAYLKVMQQEELENWFQIFKAGYCAE